MTLAITERVGLAVMDIQTLHRGHNNLLTEMRMTCDRAIIGIGSVRKFATPGHPFSYAQRVEMVRRIHGDFFDFVGLDDIDASYDIEAWYRYVKAKIVHAGLPEPTDYFGGSVIDAKWYLHAFARLEAPCVETAMTKVYRDPGTDRRLHIVDRQVLGLPSGREIRLLIETHDEEWKRYVPERLHDYVEQNYPPHLRQPLTNPEMSWRPRPGEAATSFGKPEKFVEGVLAGKVIVSVAGKHPVGTRVNLASIRSLIPKPKKTVLLELKDDGFWRPVNERDEKADWAAAQAAAGAYI